MTEFQVEPHSFEAVSHYQIAQISEHLEEPQRQSAFTCDKSNTNETTNGGLKHVGE